MDSVLFFHDFFTIFCSDFFRIFFVFLRSFSHSFDLHFVLRLLTFCQNPHDFLLTESVFVCAEEPKSSSGKAVVPSSATAAQ